MRIGVVSDSHGNLYMLDKAIKLMGDIDVLIHLGDHSKDAINVNKKYSYELVYVAGNNDYAKPEDAERMVVIGGKRIFLTHGHRYSVALGLLQLGYKATELGAEIVLFGHTHRYLVDNNNGVFYLNPGSVSRPRDQHSSAAVLTISDDGTVTARKLLVDE